MQAFLINLDISEDCPYESTSSGMAQRTAQKSQVDGDQRHVTKIETKLQEAMHLEFEDIVVDGVQKYIC